MLNIRGARLRAEVFLNEQLVGYSIMSELPIACDLTRAMRPGQSNRLAIRITNPGGRFDWRDSTTMMWGKAKLFASHGFGGLDRGLTLSIHPLAARIADAWVLNTPDPRRVTAFMEIALDRPLAVGGLDRLKAKASAALVDDQGRSVAAEIRLEALERLDDRRLRARFAVHAPDARLWDLDTPVLHRLQLRWTEAKGARRHARGPLRLPLVRARGAGDRRPAAPERPAGAAVLGDLVGLLGLQRPVADARTGPARGDFGQDPGAQRAALPPQRRQARGLHGHGRDGPAAGDGARRRSPRHRQGPQVRREPVARRRLQPRLPAREVQGHGPGFPLAPVAGPLHAAERDRREPGQSRRPDRA